MSRHNVIQHLSTEAGTNFETYAEWGVLRKDTIKTNAAEVVKNQIMVGPKSSRSSKLWIECGWTVFAGSMGQKRKEQSRNKGWACGHAYFYLLWIRSKSFQLGLYTVKQRCWGGRDPTKLAYKHLNLVSSSPTVAAAGTQKQKKHSTVMLGNGKMRIIKYYDSQRMRSWHTCHMTYDRLYDIIHMTDVMWHV